MLKRLQFGMLCNIPYAITPTKMFGGTLQTTIYHDSPPYVV